jgi:signal peptidase II
MFFYTVALIVLALDQLFKFLAQHFLAGKPIMLIGKVVKLNYTQNTGAAFSLFTGGSTWLAVIALIVVVVILFWQRKLPARDYWWQGALALILGGSLGNLVDRLLHGYVIDYIDFTYWPVFNLADMMIDLGVGLIALKLLFGKENKNASGIA